MADGADPDEHIPVEDLTPEEASRIIHSHRKVRYGESAWTWLIAAILTVLTNASRRYCMLAVSAAQGKMRQPATLRELCQERASSAVFL
jgi:hypothetical protein